MKHIPAHSVDDRLRTMLDLLSEAQEFIAPEDRMAFTERAINFGLKHGLSLQDIQRLTPRNRDGSPASLAGAVIDIFVNSPPGKKN
jgi:membrane-bound lytic murein transglycosylase MltF